MRNGAEKTPPKYSIVKFPMPTQRWLLYSPDCPGEAFEPAQAQICLLSGPLAPGIGSARFVGKLLKVHRLL
jgi:hypothetical protein